jgi:hypothetical protein
VVKCYIQFRKELRTHVYQHDQPSLITLPAPTQQSIAQGRKKNREKTGTKFYCPLDKERAISTTELSEVAVSAAPTTRKPRKNQAHEIAGARHFRSSDLVRHYHDDVVETMNIPTAIHEPEMASHRWERQKKGLPSNRKAQQAIASIAA